MKVDTCKQWKLKGDRFEGKVVCLRHAVTDELCAFGQKGQIYKYGENSYAAITYGRNDDGVMERFHPSEIKQWAKKLGVRSRGQTLLIR